MIGVRRESYQCFYLSLAYCKSTVRKIKNKNTLSVKTFFFFFAAEFQEKNIENNILREELIRLKQENQLLKKEITAVEFQRMSMSLLYVL